MKTLLVAISLILSFATKDKLVGSIWICKVSDGCVDTLKFKSHGQVIDYSCEQEYAFRGTYKVFKDTLTITVKDDSHSEDNGKVAFYRTRYLMTKENMLQLLSNSKMNNGKWKYESAEKSVYRRVN